MSQRGEDVGGVYSLRRSPVVQPQDLAAFLAQLSRQNDYQWAWNNFLDAVRELIRLSDAERVMEIGGGRFPALDQTDVALLGFEYISNDIAQSELDRAPEWVTRACFDVQTSHDEELDRFRGEVDIIFSRMVMEHVHDHLQAYRNIYTLLKSGGVAIAHHPVYFALPFLLNTILPEHVSRRVLERVFHARNDEGVPKFPAHYDGCVISSAIRQKIKDIGFSHVIQVPFYGHGYYKKVPVLRDIHSRASRWIAKAKFVPLAAYCYTVVVK